jgi:predicted RNA-binding protein with PUA-like domain
MDQLRSDQRTNWDQVRNFQARNNLRKMKLGDRCLIYHSGDERAVMGVAEVVREAYPDVDEDGGDWCQVDIEFRARWKTPVPLSVLKSTPALAQLSLIRQSRLSVCPVSTKEWAVICELAGEEA